VFRAFWDTVIDGRANGLKLSTPKTRAKKVTLDVTPEKCEIEDDSDENNVDE